MKKEKAALLLLVVWGLAGCAAHIHTVGQGSEGRSQPSVLKRQFYVLDWKPLNTVDTRLMAASIPAYTPAYTIHTRRTFTDLLIRFLTGGLITSRTVTVIRLIPHKETVKDSDDVHGSQASTPEDASSKPPPSIPETGATSFPMNIGPLQR